MCWEWTKASYIWHDLVQLSGKTNSWHWGQTGSERSLCWAQGQHQSQGSGRPKECRPSQPYCLSISTNLPWMSRTFVAYFTYSSVSWNRWKDLEIGNRALEKKTGYMCCVIIIHYMTCGSLKRSSQQKHRVSCIIYYRWDIRPTYKTSQVSPSQNALVTTYL